ncbi:MAG: CHAT domain-containing protein [Blastocatellia bacterium]
MEAIRPAIENPPPSRCGLVLTRFALGVGAIVVVALLGGITAYFLIPRGSDVERGTRALVEAFSKRRLIEPRLSGGFKAGRFNPDTSDASGINGGELQNARDLLTDAAVRGDAPSQLAYGRLLLLDGKSAVALKRIRAAVKALPESAEAHNDLGVCLIQAGKIEEAIDEFEAALKQKTDMPEALFNRALCYRRLLLSQPAGADLKRLAETERDELWLNEAKQHLDEVSRPPTLQNSTKNKTAEFDEAVVNGDVDGARKLAAQNYQLIRRHAILDVAAQQLRAAADGHQAEAERLLSEMELIGGVFVETKGDALIADAARYVGALKASEQVTELELITDFIEAQLNFELSNAGDCGIFNRSFRQFRNRGNQAFEHLSAAQLADCYYAANDFGDSIRIIKDTLTSFEGHMRPYDRARLLTLLALETSLLGQDSLAIKYFEQALSVCNSLEFEPRILQSMSVPYLRLGDFDTALERLRDSTELVLENGLPSGFFASLGYNYIQIANIYSLRSEHGLALHYAEQAVNYADQANDIHYAAEFSSFLAVQQAKLNRFANAEAQVKRAFDYLDRIKAGRPRDFTEVNVLTNAGEVAARSGNARYALQCYEKAEGLVPRDEGEGLQMIDILRGRAEAHRLGGQSDRAYSDLRRAISLIENYRANVEKSDQRIHFLAASHDAFDQLISLDLSALARVSEAFEMAERFRARALLEEISRPNMPGEERSAASTQSFANISRSRASVNPLKLSEVQSALPDDLTLLAYSVTSQRTYLFLVTRNGITVRESTATTEILDRLVPDYVSDLRQMAPIEEVNEKARALYDYLIKPVEKEIAGNTRICIVPDEALHFLPFAALLDREGKYLVESHGLVYAPSASVLIRCIKESQTHSAGEVEKILAVGNPQFNSEGSRLPSLPDAEIESMESARLYAPSMVVLRGPQATEPTVRAAMRDCDVAHFAVHCLVEEESPDLAALVLANANPNKSFLRARSESAEAAGSQTMSGGSAGTRRAALAKAFPQEPVNDPNDGLLFLKELYGLRLPRTKLVVLSACQSGLGQYHRGEGIVSLVRPFLAAGVPTIVASLWSIDSKATTHLMIDFHRQRKLGRMQAGDALRLAQIQMARSGPYQHPFHWAPFIVIGSAN